VRNNDELISYLKAAGVLKDSRLEKALKKVPRELFCESEPYDDNAKPIGFGATISQPSTIVMMTQALAVDEGDNVLEVGTGSGYQAALLWAMGCKVTSVERDGRVLDIARKNLQKVKAKIELLLGDGSKGCEKNAPYDAIIVTAAAPKVPEPLVKQLKVGGRLVIPVGNPVQEMKLILKKERGAEEKSLGAFVFVPLIGEHGF